MLSHFFIPGFCLQIFLPIAIAVRFFLRFVWWFVLTVAENELGTGRRNPVFSQYKKTVSHSGKWQAYKNHPAL
jgi:hypothetical protein